MWLAPVALASIFLALSALLAQNAPERSHFALRGNPTSGGIYFIGNSMFGTGLDIEALHEAFPNETATFGYYDGYYTSMWYEAFRNSLIPSQIRPKVVIWGFRPTYADLPAFRQNRETDLDRLYDANDTKFEAVLAVAGDESRNGRRTTFNQRNRLSFFDWLGDAAPIVRRRGDLRDVISRRLAHFIAASFAETNETAERFADQHLGLKISDIIVSFSTNGRIQKADALVIDNGERFISGEEVDFDKSFSPLIAELLRSAKIPQLVIIFKPVSVLDGKMPEAAASYHRDAIAFFERENIPYVDFVSDPHLTRSFYAKGDHYTSEGMAYVTARIIESLRAERLVE